MRWGKNLRWLLMAAALACAPVPVGALSSSDVLVGLETLQLLSDKPSGTIVVAIVYDPSNRISSGDAEDVQSLFNHGIDVLSSIKPTGLMVPVNDLGKLSKARVAIIMQNTQSSMGAIAAAANANHVLTMSSDLSCVKSGKCVLGMVTEPSTEIYYNKAAGEAAQIKFAPAFLMLVKLI